MAVVVESYPHRTGEHCASTALRNILAHRGTELSEGMVFGLASGLGFFYLRDEHLSPTRMFHGRTMTLEGDFGRNTGIDLVDRPEPDDDRAWLLLRERIDAGQPVMLNTDTFYLDYHKTSSHFPGHRCVAVGYDDDTETVLIADRKFEEYQRCSFEELRRSRNAPDYPMRCDNRWGDFGTDTSGELALAEAVRRALLRNARAMLEPSTDLPSGIPAMRALAADLPRWVEAADWSWASRFGYQVVIKRGAGGSFFRSLYADFLRESEALLPALSAAKLAERMDRIAAGWRELAAPLKEQSERETCEPRLFAEAARRAARLADLEEGFFRDVMALGLGGSAVPSGPGPDEESRSQGT
ncbi:MAG: BtrH N-terminal domain-containing protein [Myxococcota bacterium]|nr:BtrH N-terminal domain-containing protein [Myxococcota bacterium]